MGVYLSARSKQYSCFVRWIPGTLTILIGVIPLGILLCPIPPSPHGDVMIVPHHKTLRCEDAQDATLLPVRMRKLIGAGYLRPYDWS